MAPVTVYAIDNTYTSNADLIVACRELGYLRDHVATLDATYGMGTFWTKWKPEGWFIGNDIDPDKGAYTGDFTDLRWEDCSFEQVVFDPPYKLNGTPDGAVDYRYGVHEVRTWQQRMELIEAGVKECARVTASILLVKCQDQVVSGHVVWQVDEVTRWATECGLVKVDLLHYQGGREQPSGRRQVHARRNYSSLIVFCKDGSRK